MASGVMRKLIEVYMSNGIDETNAAHFAYEFMRALNEQPSGTTWYIRGANGVECKITKGNK